MPKHCCWGECNSDTRYPERCENIQFIPFVKPTKPWNRDQCLRWIRACGRPQDQLNINKIKKHHYICSKVSSYIYFTENDQVIVQKVTIYYGRCRIESTEVSQCSKTAAITSTSNKNFLKKLCLVEVCFERQCYSFPAAVR